MARKKRAYRDDYQEERAGWNPEITQGVLAILLFLAAGLAALSFFEAAGLVGKFINDFLALLFGAVRYVVPLLLAFIAVMLLKDRGDDELEYRSTHYIGAALFLISFNAIIHLRIPLEDMVQQALEGYGGGLFGLALGWPLMKFTGFWASIFILIALLLISFLLLFNTSLAHLISVHRKALDGLGTIGDVVLAFPRLFRRKGVKVHGAHERYEEDDENAPEFSSRALDEDEENEDADEEEEHEEEEDDEDEEEEKDMETRPRRSYKGLPKLDLLFSNSSKPTSGDIQANAAVIQDTLGNFGIEVDMGEVRVGPTVTQYSLKPARGVKLSRITALANDLALALAAHPIRIEAPIPGKSLVGIEVPNQRVAMVSLRELLESKEWKSRSNNMHIALGKDVAGKVWCGDLPKMPHLLIAGATGSGKTVCINTILLSLLYENTAETLRLIMVDPKRVELTMYNGIPHLLTPVITDHKKTVNALRWTINEMNRRFDLLSLAGRRDINSYNQSADETLPHIVFVIDELADLMAMAASEVEAGIIRLAQMARAVGIHLIVATQRPSTEVITGLMKANIPARIAFSVASHIDSRTILDCPGAEKLLGRGDMLFLSAEMSKPMRLQGAFISEEELQRVIKHLKGNNGDKPEYDESITGVIHENSSGTINMFGGADDDYDLKFEDAKQIVLESGKASASLLQRRMKIGYARAARILDELEEAGIVGPADGAKPREVFTEHLRVNTAKETTPKEQSLDSGGAPVFFDSSVKEEDEENNDENEVEILEEEKTL